MSKNLEPLHLSESKIKELQTQYKQERDRQMAERIQCIILYAQGKNLNELKRILFVGLKTLKKWIKTYMVQGLDGLQRARERPECKPMGRGGSGVGTPTLSHR
jgi:hypothetical protein